MKCQFTLWIMCLSSLLFGQGIIVTDSVNWPLGLEIKDNYLYISEATSDIISKLDLDDENAEPIPVVGGFDRPNFSDVLGHDLYFTSFGNGMIYKIDLREDDPETIVMVEGLTNPKGILIRDSILYYTQPGVISKVDLRDPELKSSVLYDEVDAFSNLALHGDKLFFSEHAMGRISSLDLTEENPQPSILLSNLDGPLGGMNVIDDKLFFFEYLGKRFSYFDLVDPEVGIVTIDDDVEGAGVQYYNNAIYISDFKADLIIKYERFISDVDEFKKTIIQLYPNPTTDFLHFDRDLSRVDISICNMDGKIITSMNGFSGSELDVSFLPAGSYVLMLNGEAMKKFVKL